MNKASVINNLQHEFHDKYVFMYFYINKYVTSSLGFLLWDKCENVPSH